MRTGPKVDEDLHSTEQICKIVKRYPGVHFRRICSIARSKFIVSSPNKVKELLHKLEKQGRLYNKREKNKTCYYPNPMLGKAPLGVGTTPLFLSTVGTEEDILSLDWFKIFKQHVMIKHFLEYVREEPKNVDKDYDDNLKISDNNFPANVTEYDVRDINSVVMQKAEEAINDIIQPNRDLFDKKFSEVQMISNQILHRLFAALLMAVYNYKTSEINKKLKKKFFMSAINELCDGHSKIFNKAVKAMLVGMSVDWKFDGDEIFTKRYLHEAFDLKSRRPT